MNWTVLRSNKMGQWIYKKMFILFLHPLGKCKSKLRWGFIVPQWYGYHLENKQRTLVRTEERGMLTHCWEEHSAVLAWPLWKKLTTELPEQCHPWIYSWRIWGLLHSSLPCPLLDFILNANVWDQVSYDNTWASFCRPEWLAMPWILWESQVPSRKLSCPTGDKKWPLEFGWFTGPRCLHIGLGKTVIRAHITW